MVQVSDEYYEYMTMQGDTFDMISLDFYGDEMYAYIIIQANSQYRDVLIFDGDITLKIPEIIEETSETLPPWKR